MNSKAAAAAVAVSFALESVAVASAVRSFFFTTRRWWFLFLQCTDSPDSPAYSPIAVSNIEMLRTFA